MKFAALLAFLLAALLLSGCAATAAKAEKADEKTKPAMENESKTANKPASNKTAPANPEKTKPAMENESKTANETPLKNESSATIGTANKTAHAIPHENETAMENKTAAGVPIAYFYSTICGFCANATIYMGSLEEKYPVFVQKYEIYYNLSNFNLLKQYAYEYRLKGDEFVVPIVFINTTYFAGPDIYGGLEKKIQNLTKKK